MTFGEVTSASGFDGVTFDGLFGLAYKSISADGVEPVFATMVSQGLVGQNLFGVYLSNDTTKDGALTLGGTDTTVCTFAFLSFCADPVPTLLMFLLIHNPLPILLFHPPTRAVL